MPNRLANESSPYLLQHKDNPVDWYPWGEDALRLAREADKPIFLSVGYSACHWCHVMEHESFENDAIAQVLNDNFVSIKVDREERPDLDSIYMEAVMALRQGQGGWPLSVFLTPEQEVFFGGTYWPPTSRVGMPGFDHVLHSVLDAYTNRREQVADQSKQITAWLNRPEEINGQFEPRWEVLQHAASTLHGNFDFVNGGFGSAPKFPHAMDLALLVRLAATWPDDAAMDKDVLLEMVRINLKKMSYGGIFDHLAGGFARYSVDELWLVPHFEKMLYDNALLAGVYLDMFKQTGDAFYSMIARKTLDYLLTYMQDESGGIHSTEDADSEGVEGKFYVWSREEVLQVLGQETGVRFCELYNVTFGGNFEGSNILNMTQSYQQFADDQGIEKQALRDEMRDARKKLLEVRDQRIRPGKDDKVIVSWNALAISAFARASILLDDNTYLDAARRAANFLLADVVRDDGRLLHTWRHGKAKIDGYLDDYSCLINSILDLYTVSLDQVWISKACGLTETMIELFFDRDSGGFYFTASDQERLIARPKHFQDSSVPSGNSMAALALIRLGRLTGRTDWLEFGSQTIVAAGGLIQRSVLASGQMLIAMHELLSPSRQFVVVVNNDQQAEELRQKIISSVQRFEDWIIFVAGESPAEELQAVLSGKQLVDGEPALYQCEGMSCSEPIVGWNAIVEML